MIGAAQGEAPAPSRRRRTGFSLVEVVVAVVVVEVGLLGVAAMLHMAAARMAGAARLERATALAEAAADSIFEAGWGGEGEIEQGTFLVRWSREEGVTRVEVLHGPESREPVVRVAWVGP